MVISTENSIERNFRIANNNAIYMYVNKMVRLRRTLLGMSQEQLGTELNITFQQVQKYERGPNRVSASGLLEYRQILDVPISYFFDDMSQDTMKSSPRRIGRGGEVINQHGDQTRNPMARREILELVRTYYTIEKPIV
jgi:transcriptional regulator with XRE-family HTH domain